MLFRSPTTGLDPITATSINDEVVKLRDLEQVTSIVVTHQIRDAYYVATHEATRTGDTLSIREVSDPTHQHARFLVLHEGRIYFEGTGSELLGSQDAFLKEFLFMTLPPW